MSNIDQLRSSQSVEPSKNNGVQATSKNVTAKSAETTSTTTAPAGKDSFVLSDDSAKLDKLNKKLANESSFDNAKVARIKAEITDGNYKVDAEKLANNMLKHEKELR